MSTKKLDEAVRAYYREAELPLETLERWQRTRPPRTKRPFLVTAFAAGTLALAVLTVLVFDGPSPEQRLATEVWAHHRAAKPVDVRAANIEALGRRLVRLDFRLRSSRRLGDLRTHGGRYCSLKGQVAAQAILEDAAGRRHTLYATPSTPRFENIDAATVEMAEGGQVAVWREHGIIYALASGSSGKRE